MVNFCTLFDSNYLTRGLALYQSLEKECPSFHLYVVAFNADCYNYLKSASLQHLTAIALADFEDEALLRIKPTRSAAEYCWTCTPSIIQYCIQTFNLPSCTYVDADMVFYHDPAVLIEEMGKDSVLITEHRYTKDYDQSKYSGIYCVQFMCFKNDERGMKALDWWREKCIDWCYARQEDGKFGDQKYLDDWLTRFEGVHVLRHPGGGIAPWNLQQFSFMEKGGSIDIKEKNSSKIYPLVFFHFHGVKFYTDGYISCCEALYQIEPSAKKIIYLPYFRNLLKLEGQLRKSGLSFNVNGARTPSPSKTKILSQYVKDVLATWKLGNIKYPPLQLFDISRHNHFYKMDWIKQTKWQH